MLGPDKGEDGAAAPGPGGPTARRGGAGCAGPSPGALAAAGRPPASPSVRCAPAAHAAVCLVDGALPARPLPARRGALPALAAMFRRCFNRFVSTRAAPLPPRRRGPSEQIWGGQGGGGGVRGAASPRRSCSGKHVVPAAPWVETRGSVRGVGVVVPAGSDSGIPR